MSQVEIHPTARIADNVTILGQAVVGAGTRILPGAVIGRPPIRAGTTNRPIDSGDEIVRIGANCVIGANAVIYTDVQIGSNVMVSDLASLREGCRLEDDTIVGRASMLMHDVTVQARSRIHDMVHLTGHMLVEPDVFVGPSVSSANDNRVYLTRFWLAALWHDSASHPALRCRWHGRNHRRGRGNRQRRDCCARGNANQRRASLDDCCWSARQAAARSGRRLARRHSAQVSPYGRGGRMSLVSIVVPVYHNAPSLADLLRELQALAARNENDQFEFIFVDDGSRDESFAVLQGLAQCEPRMRVARLSRNFGSVAAVMAGLSLARGDCAAAISADLQEPPALLHEMLGKWRRGQKSRAGGAAQTRRTLSRLRYSRDAFYAMFRRYAIASMPRARL